MKLTPVTIDFETYYDTDYSLKKIKTAIYVRDERFQVHGVSIKIGTKPTKFYRGKDVARALQNISWQNAELVGHNLTFDGLILSHHYGHRPARYFDTKALCAPIMPSSQRKSLDNCAAYLLKHNAGKISGLAQTKGKRTLDEADWRALEKYCDNDVELTWQLYNKFNQILPVRERYLSHMTSRMAADPVLHLNSDLLNHEVQRLKDQRDELLRQCPVSKSVLSSNPKFVQWIESNSLDVPMKISPSTGKPTPALANDDLGYRELQADHPEFKPVWDARRVVKSTIGLTRAEAFLTISTQGTMPMPLNYYGAHTGRWSGADGLNVQNLPRLNPNDPYSGALRRSIIAPDGYVVLVLDLSQIELRLNAWFCGEWDKLDILRGGGDVYLHAATKHFGYDCNKRDHVHERFFGKMLELALGYNMGWRKLRVNAALGFMGTPPVQLTELEAKEAVDKWRFNNRRTKDMWGFLSENIHEINKDNNDLKFNDFLPVGGNSIILPNDMTLHYHDLRYSHSKESWVYDTGKKLYGGIMLENIIQALARVVISDQMYKVDQHPDINVVGMTHDEIIALVPEDKAEWAFNTMKEIMTEPPSWAPDLPLDAEGGYAKNYSK